MICGGRAADASTGVDIMSRIMRSVIETMSWPSIPTPATGPRVPGSSSTTRMPETFSLFDWQPATRAETASTASALTMVLGRTVSARLMRSMGNPVTKMDYRYLSIILVNW